MARLGVTMVVVLGFVAVSCGSDGGADPAGGGGNTPAPPTDAAVTDDVAGDADADPQPDAGDQIIGGFDVDSAGNFVEPCSVLTEQAVADATGLVVTGSEDRGPEGCTWFVESVDDSILEDDAIYWQPFRAEQFAPQKQAIDQGLEGEPIAGLGNDAVFIGPAMFGEVWVQLDGLSFRVGNQFAFKNFDGRPVQEALAQALIGALG